MDRMKLILHPVRMRVMLALANRVLTTQQLADLLPDVAQTTLYRHINLLLEGGILTVVRESKVRGTIERALTLTSGAGRIDMETSASLPPEQHEQLFTTLIASLLADFRRSLSHPQDGIPPAFYRQQRLYLTVEELQALNRQLDALFANFQDAARQATDANVRPWSFTGIVMPDAALPPANEEETDEADV
ncbi:MAG: helix-turn-helix domain-containing protein [Chloroflexota bacterium]|nr:MAG: ArsR family transcriptional regulator [Chloroflexota bacterium]